MNKEQFLSKVKKSKDCWIWQGAISGRGYGNVTFDGRTTGAHRVSYILFKGEIVGTKDVCHTCDNPSCVNPKHLFLGTRTDNMHDAMKKGRIACGERCPQHILNGNQVEKIRKIYEAGGRTQRSIAKQFGVDYRRINDIIKNNNWKMSNEKKVKIELDKWYNMQEIVREKMFPWALSFWSVRRIVDQDRINSNILKANITGDGRAKKYHFKGENIIKFIKEFEAGKIKL